MILSFSWASIVFDLLCMCFCFWGTTKIKKQLRDVTLISRNYREEMTRNFEEYHLTVAHDVFKNLERFGVKIPDYTIVNGHTYKEVREYFKEGEENG